MGIERRHFLRMALSAGLAAPILGACQNGQATTGAAPKVPGLDLSGDFRGIHDPALVVEGDTVHLFTTSHLNSDRGLIHWYTSKDLRNWTQNGAVFEEMPPWAPQQVPGTRGLWAPDIVDVGDEFRIYYSVSTFGSNHSAIGMARTPTLDRNDPAFGWKDEGIVITSDQDDYYNAIDPNIVIDQDGRHWMSFGSFWSGIKLFELDPATGKALSANPELHAISRRSDPGAVEAPYIVWRDGYYYLFVAFDFCCRGANSTYRTVVGRSRSIAGPYMDRAGAPMLSGAGTTIVDATSDPTGTFVGPGHPAVLKYKGDYVLAYHAYDTTRNGLPTLRLQKLDWTEDGWPVPV